VVDAAAERKEALVGVGDVGFDLLRRHTGVERGDNDDGDVDLGEKIDGHARYRRCAHDQNHEAEHQDEERILDRER
jgi:hypothetical protein